MYEYEPENGLRTDLVAAVARHAFHWSELSLTDDQKKEERKVSVKASRSNDGGQDYASGDALRTDILAVLDEHGYELSVFQLGDTPGAANLVATAHRNLNGTQVRLPGT